MNPERIIGALAQALYHSCWQALAVAAAVAGVSFATSSPRARYAAGVAGLAALPLLFAATALNASAGAGDDVLLTLTLGARSAGAAGPLPLEAWLLMVCAAGAGAMALRVGVGWLSLRRIVARALPSADLQRRVDRIAADLGVRARVRATVLAADIAPMVLGFIEPVLVMPLGAITRLDQAQLEAVLAHELWHVRCFDFAVNLAQSLVEAVLFFHPAVWWLSRRVRAWREECCDDAAVRFSGDPLRYARALTELESARVPAASPVAALGDGSLRARLERLLPQRALRARPARRALPVVVVTAAVAGAAAAFVGACIGEPDELDRMPVEAQLYEIAPSHPQRFDIAWMPPSVARFAPLFLAAAARHGVDPEMLAIVTLVESGGWVEARSKSGARGLMQIMPATGETIAKERGLPDHDADKLADPAYNIDFGAWYLARQLERFATPDGDEAVERAAAAYNGGPNRLQRHLAGEADLSDETTRYKRWVRNMWAERDRPESATLREWLEAGGSRLVARGASEMK